MTDVVDKIGLLTKRDLERKTDLAKRKEGRDLLAANNEKLDYFEETFIFERSKIEKLLEKSTQLERNQLAEHFDAIAKQILTLQKYVAASNIFLRTYDIKKCQESLQELASKSRDLENELLPKKKFGFKNKPQVKPTIENPQEILTSKISKSLPKLNLCGFSNKSDEVLVLNRDETGKKDICLENLTNCCVKIFGSPSTVHMNGLKDCKVLTGPVSTSIFAENCLNSVLVIACQQLRLHSSKNLQIYLHVTSRAIMEDCNNIFITPYNWNYPELDQDFQESSLDRSTNHWQAVDDFNWLKVGQKSPNWSVLDPNLLVETWDHL